MDAYASPPAAQLSSGAEGEESPTPLAEQGSWKGKGKVGKGRATVAGVAPEEEGVVQRMYGSIIGFFSSDDAPAKGKGKGKRKGKGKVFLPQAPVPEEGKGSPQDDLEEASQSPTSLTSTIGDWWRRSIYGEPDLADRNSMWSSATQDEGPVAPRTSHADDAVSVESKGSSLGVSSKGRGRNRVDELIQIEDMKAGAKDTPSWNATIKILKQVVEAASPVELVALHGWMLECDDNDDGGKCRCSFATFRSFFVLWVTDATDSEVERVWQSLNKSRRYGGRRESNIFETEKEVNGSVTADERSAEPVDKAVEEGKETNGVHAREINIVQLWKWMSRPTNQTSRLVVALEAHENKFGAPTLQRIANAAPGPVACSAVLLELRAWKREQRIAGIVTAKKVPPLALANADLTTNGTDKPTRRQTVGVPQPRLNPNYVGLLEDLTKWIQSELSIEHEVAFELFAKHSAEKTFTLDRQEFDALLDDLVQYMDEPVRQSLWNQMDVDRNAHVSFGDFVE
jgi:hypothetical protein